MDNLPKNGKRLYLFHCIANLTGNRMKMPAFSFLFVTKFAQVNLAASTQCIQKSALLSLKFFVNNKKRKNSIFLPPISACCGKKIR